MRHEISDAMGIIMDAQQNYLNNLHAIDKPDSRSQVINISVQWEPENSRLGKRLLDLNYDFK